MSFLFKLTIAILIVFAILFPILISSDNKLSALFWKIPKDFWVFLIIMYWAIITVVFIESSEQARIRRQQYLQQYKMPNEVHENVVIENSIISRETTDDESDINTLYLDSFKSKNGFAPIFPDTCYHLTHYWLAAVDIPVASDNPVHYADAIRYNARTPLQGSLLPLTRLVWA